MTGFKKGDLHTDGLTYRQADFQRRFVYFDSFYANFICYYYY